MLHYVNTSKYKFLKKIVKVVMGQSISMINMIGIVALNPYIVKKIEDNIVNCDDTKKQYSKTRLNYYKFTISCWHSNVVLLVLLLLSWCHHHYMLWIFQIFLFTCLCLILSNHISDGNVFVSVYVCVCMFMCKSFKLT